ncbi:hypothetical protein ACFFUP_14795 [Vibrio ostreicida]|uniref:Uncharacterized protein n=1 Tax=Vibrio ostreicida TaxID=526588 RepID=A0ABT8BSQ2_9VIBR|nr:hypothetical protein [Vibrio ostreicida]MDN3609978.1 hypothetical protein [Vibrio ostreicida]NPD10403.1 hypothetical protein [Vibrio ostreicida]
MSNETEKDFNLGGSIERALSGDYELKAVDVLKEAWELTTKNFFSFLPATILLLAVQLLIVYVALTLQLDDLNQLVTLVDNPDEAKLQQFMQIVLVASSSYKIISAPIFAGVMLMALSHTVGLPTKLQDMTKGLQYTIPIIVATSLSLSVQWVLGALIPFITLYLSLAFSNALLLICDKQVSPAQSLLLSLRAANKKIISLAGIYLAITLMFVVGALPYGLGLVFVIPFYFHAKGIIYREMFGTKLTAAVIGKPKGKDDDNDDNSQLFNA